MNEIKIGDCVQLMHGYTVKMNVSAINEETKMATLVWFDPKTRKNIIDVLPLNVLKVVVEPPPIDVKEILSAFGH